jgi:shikimate kinase
VREVREVKKWYKWHQGVWECTITLPAVRATGCGRSKKAAYDAACAALYGRPVVLTTNNRRVRLYG